MLKQMFKAIIEMHRPPTPLALATRELQDAQRELLAAYSTQEYAASQVQFNEDRVARLERTLAAWEASRA